MSSKVTCSSCGHSWSKSDSSKKDASVCHICGKDNTMKDGGWLDKYQEGGPIQPNYNDSNASAGPGFQGDGYSNVGRNYSPAWGGQFQDGGTLKDNAERALALGSIATPFPLNYGLSLAGSAIDLYDAYNAKNPHDRNVQLTEAALGAIPYGRIVKGMKLGTDAYKAYKALKPIAAINSVIDVKDTVDPNLKYAMGGSIPGAVGFTYARTNSPAPSEGPYAKKTMASAQNGAEMSFYQEGLDFKPKSISRDGSQLVKLDQLLNFTNYDKPTKGGWLDKYK